MPNTKVVPTDPPLSPKKLPHSSFDPLVDAASTENISIKINKQLDYDQKKIGQDLTIKAS